MTEISHAQAIFFFGNGQADGSTEFKPLVGGKGASLAEMTRAGLNVPPGFTISAECCRQYYQRGKQWPEGLQEEIRRAMSWLEQQSGLPFGCGDHPLLVAVRSGSGGQALYRRFLGATGVCAVVVGLIWLLPG